MLYDKGGVMEQDDITTAYVPGRNKLVVIKTGAGGTVEGYEGKYTKLSKYIHEATGYAVLVVDNPLAMIDEENFEVTMTAIEYTGNVVETDDGEFPEVIYIGISKGASMAAIYGWQYQEIKRMLLINPPLMINWHKQKVGLEKFNGEFVNVVIGGKDPSCRFAGLIECLDTDKVQKSIVSGMDHNFKCGEHLIWQYVDEILKTA